MQTWKKFDNLKVTNKLDATKIAATGGIAGWGAAVSTSQIAALTTTGVASLSTAQTAALTTTQLTALCANNDLIISALQKLGVAP